MPIALSARMAFVLVVALSTSGASSSAQNRRGWETRPVIPGERMSLSCLDGGALFPPARDTSTTLKKRTLVFRPAFVEPALYVKREFREAELIETVGPHARRLPVVYRGGYWCTPSPSGEQCSILADAVSGSSLTVKDAAGRYTDEVIPSTVAPFLELRPSTRGNCRFDVFGWMSNDPKWLASAERSSAAERAPAAEVWAVIDTMRPDLVTALTPPPYGGRGNPCGPARNPDPTFVNMTAALQTGCTTEYTSNDILFASGMAAYWVDACSALHGVGLTQVIAGASVIGVGGQNQQAPYNLNATLAFRTGSDAARRLGCDAAGPILREFRAMIDKAAANTTYVDGCAKIYDQTRCQCVATVGFPLVPPIHRSEFLGDAGLVGLTSRNKGLVPVIAALCGITHW